MPFLGTTAHTSVQAHIMDFLDIKDLVSMSEASDSIRVDSGSQLTVRSTKPCSRQSGHLRPPSVAYTSTCMLYYPRDSPNLLTSASSLQHRRIPSHSGRSDTTSLTCRETWSSCEARTSTRVFVDPTCGEWRMDITSWCRRSKTIQRGQSLLAICIYRSDSELLSSFEVAHGLWKNPMREAGIFTPEQEGYPAHSAA